MFFLLYTGFREGYRMCYNEKKYPPTIFPYTILIGGVCVILLSGFLVWKQRMSSRTPDQHTKKENTVVIIEKLEVNLTIAQWYSEIVLMQDSGKLNFSQVEYLHKANEACILATRNVQALFRIQGLGVTSTEWAALTKGKVKKNTT